MQAAASRTSQAAPELVLVAILFALMATSVAATLSLGWTALTLPLLALAIVVAAASPHDFAILLVSAAVVLEPGAIDASGELAPLLYELPAGVQFPITISPLEIALSVACLSAVLRAWRKRGSVRPPLIAAALPLAVVGGFIHGWRLGGDLNLAYNEARGLIFGAVVFLLAATCPPGFIGKVRSWLFASTTLLACLVLYRYFAFVKPGDLNVPIEFAFAHEDSILLGAGLACGITTLARSSLTMRDRILLCVYVVLVGAAMAATQRRAATLVGLVGAGTAGALIFTKRPALVVIVGTPLLALFAVYLGAYWDREYGTLAQPARAVRSQIDPTPRDESSDRYRDVERSNVIETVRLNRALGVGFGRPFAQFQALPNLESFWPLQLYTPHQNVLWLWLKLGLAGLAAFLALISIALSRCLAVVRESPVMDDRATLAVVVAAVLLMYLAFATVDLALVGIRGSIPLAVALAVAFGMPSARPSLRSCEQVR